MMAPRPSERSAPNNEILTKLPPAQLREMREAFQVLDRNNDGQVNRDDVADILLNLGLSVSICARRHVEDTS
jgi:Ca2+-binding EF-hand superfamily protein